MSKRMKESDRKIRTVMRKILLYPALAILIISGCLFDNDENSSKQNTQPTEPPSAPTGLTADVSVPYAITLNWNDNSDNEEGFALNLSTHLPPNTTQWTRTDLEQPYYSFQLFAYNDAGISSSVWSGLITVTWEYPHIYKINTINAEVYNDIKWQKPNGFICVYEDSVAISFTCTVDGKERVVMENSKRPVAHLSITRDQVWYTKYFEYDNYNQNKCSIWAIRVDSFEDITD